MASKKTEGMPDEAAGALCYVLGPLTAVLFLSLSPYKERPFVQFHGWQCLFLSGAAAVLNMGLLGAVMILPWALVGVIWFLMFFSSLAWIGLWFWLMYQAWTGEEWEVPGIGAMVRRRLGR